jgi:hypothetical protein
MHAKQLHTPQICERAAKACSAAPSDLDRAEICEIADQGIAMADFGRLAKGMAEYRARRFALPFARLHNPIRSNSRRWFPR